MGTKVPEYEKSQERKFPGTFVLRERKFPGTKVPGERKFSIGYEKSVIPQSTPITNLLTNVLIVSVKYTMSPSVRRNVNVLIEAGP